MVLEKTIKNRRKKCYVYGVKRKLRHTNMQQRQDLIG